MWIGSAIGIVVAATWLMVTEKVNSHAHADYARVRDFEQIADQQVIIQQTLQSLAIDIREQTKTIMEIKEKQWQVQQGR